MHATSEYVKYYYKYTCLSTPWSGALEKINHCTNEEIPDFLEPQVHHHVYNNQPCIPSLCQTNPAHVFPIYFYFFKIHFTIIFLSTLRSSKQFLPFIFSTQNLIFSSHVFIHGYYMPCSCHLDFIIPCL